MQDQNINASIASSERIAKLIVEAEDELKKIQPEIDYLEQCKTKLTELKEQQFKLNSFILSLKSIMRMDDNNKCVTNITSQNKDLSLSFEVKDNVTQLDTNTKNKRKIFLPDQAITQVKNNLRTKNNLNYEIFKAIVFNSGIASTKEIKKYLIENNIKQPKSGKGFEDVELKEISSRTNYLVRKEILVSPEPGLFKSIIGWSEIS